MTREQQYWEDTQEALSRIFDRCEEIDPQSGYDMLEDIQFIRGFINKCKPRTEKQMSCSEKPNKSEIPTSWISVSERLPENFQRVLVTIVNYNDDKVVRVAEYRDWRRTFQIKENREQWEVGEEGLLAWMPLPDPYQSDESVERG